MGGDMLLATMVAPHFEGEINIHEITELAIQVGLNRIEALSWNFTFPGELSYIADVAEIELDAEAEGVSETDVVEQIKANAISAVKAIVSDFGPRDIITLTINDRDMWVTGGMSWGDSPTDSYPLIMLLDTLDIYDNEITVAEADAGREILAAGKAAE
jgi:hypothetical protein